MSVRQLIPSLGKELDDLYARISHLEGILGVGVPSEADRSCKPCGITWQLGLTCFPQHMAGRRHNKMLMAKQTKNPPPQLDQLPKKQKQSITPSNLVSNVRSKPPPLFPPIPPSAARKPSEEGVKRENKSSSRLEICRDRRDRRSCKIFVICVIFPENNAVYYIFRKFTHT